MAVRQRNRLPAMISLDPSRVALTDRDGKEAGILAVPFGDASCEGHPKTVSRMHFHPPGMRAPFLLASVISRLQLCDVRSFRCVVDESKFAFDRDHKAASPSPFVDASSLSFCSKETFFT